MRRLIALVAVAGMIWLGLVAAAAPDASGATQQVCPPGGASNTTYNGGLLVTGNNFCSLDHVTVNGGITVDSGSDVDLESSTGTRSEAGSLFCSNGTVIFAGESGDSSANTVGGANTC